MMMQESWQFWRLRFQFCQLMLRPDGRLTVCCHHCNDDAHCLSFSHPTSDHLISLPPRTLLCSRVDIN